MFRKKVIQDTIIIKDVSFNYRLYYNPKNLPQIDQQYIIDNLGNRMQGDTVCLGTTAEVVEAAITRGDYQIVGFVKNSSTDDSASGVIQYWNWCNDNKHDKQIWIHDLCRITSGEKPIVSPTEVLLLLFEQECKRIFNKNQIIDLRLMVDRTEEGHDKLLEIYNAKYGYKIDSGCEFDIYTIMKKRIKGHEGTRSRTRKNKKFNF
jgi:hypothetical protein